MPDEEREKEITQAARSTLLLCTKGSKDQGRNFYLSKVVFRVLRDKMEEQDVKLLREWARIGDGAADGDGWREHVHGE